MKKGNKLYIAYGSNLNLEQMAVRCPTARVVGAAALEGYRLLFRGGKRSSVATVEPYEGGKVPVLVWEITPRDEIALDQYEGFPILYRKENVRVSMNGHNVDAMIYIMNNECRPLGMPSPYYYSVIRKGYHDARFDASVLCRATEDSMETDEVNA
ncbi:gamma-glutamylcyclotransferase [Clostridia bacterium]|nr:gamma-glutamylcyclotransferase [Clostridia bacterium]